MRTVLASLLLASSLLAQHPATAVSEGHSAALTAPDCPEIVSPSLWVWWGSEAPDASYTAWAWLLDDAHDCVSVDGVVLVIGQRLYPQPIQLPFPGTVGGLSFFPVVGSGLMKAESGARVYKLSLRFPPAATLPGVQHFLQAAFALEGTVLTTQLVTVTF